MALFFTTNESENEWSVKVKDTLRSWREDFLFSKSIAEKELILFRWVVSWPKGVYYEWCLFAFSRLLLYQNMFSKKLEPRRYFDFRLMHLGVKSKVATLFSCMRFACCRNAKSACINSKWQHCLRRSGQIDIDFNSGEYRFNQPCQGNMIMPSKLLLTRNYNSKKIKWIYL